MLMSQADRGKSQERFLAALEMTVTGTLERRQQGCSERWQGDGRGSGGLDAGSEAGGEGLVVLEIPGVDGLGLAFSGAG